MMENKKGGRRDPDCDKCSTTGEECSVTSTVTASLPAGGYGEFRPNAPKFGTVVPNRIFVGGIPDTVSVDELEKLFSRYGRVTQAKIIMDRGGVPKGYGFITFETDEEAKNIQMDSNVVLREKRLNIAPAIRKQMSDRIYPGLMSPIIINSTEPPMSPVGVGGGGSIVGSDHPGGHLNGGGQIDVSHYQQIAQPQYYPRRDDTTYFAPPIPYPYQGPVYHALPNGPDSAPQIMFSGYQGHYSNIPIPFQPMCYAPLTPIPNDSREPSPMSPPIFQYPCIYGAPVSPTTNSSCPEGGSGGSEASYYEPSDNYLRGQDASIFYYYNLVPPPMTPAQANPQIAPNVLAINDANDVKNPTERDVPQTDVPPQRQIAENVNASVQTSSSEATGPAPLLPVATMSTLRDYQGNVHQQQHQQRVLNRPPVDDGNYSRTPMRGGCGRGGFRGVGNLKRGVAGMNGGGGGRNYEQNVVNGHNNNNSTSCPNNYECDKKKGGMVDSSRGGRGGGHFPFHNNHPRPMNNFQRPSYTDRPPRPSNIRFLQPNYGGGEYSHNAMDANRFYPSYGGANRRGHAGRTRWYGNSLSRGGGGARYNRGGGGNHYNGYSGGGSGHKMRGQSDEGGDFCDDGERSVSGSGGGGDESKDGGGDENGVLTPPITPRSPRPNSPNGYTTSTAVAATVGSSNSGSDVDGFKESMAALTI